MMRDLYADNYPQRRLEALFKQWGGRTPKAGGDELDGQRWHEFPTITVTTSSIIQREVSA